MNKTQRPSLDELKQLLAEGIAVCWIKKFGPQEGLMQDTFEGLLAVLKHKTLSWAGLKAFELMGVNWTDDELWRLIKTLFKADENPIGVLNFTSVSQTTVDQKYDHLQIVLPGLAPTIEALLPPRT